MVEHESGLEILYIAGSIASLISLISLINPGWRNLQDRFSKPQLFRERNPGIEIRKFDPKKRLIEQNALTIEEYIYSKILKEMAALKRRVSQLEDKLAITKKENTKTKKSK